MEAIGKTSGNLLLMSLIIISIVLKMEAKATNEVPTAFNLSGTLKDSSNGLINGAKSISFNFCLDSTTTNCQSYGPVSVTVTNSRFQVSIDDASLTTYIKTSKPSHVEVNVEGEVLSRIALNAVPYAIAAGNAVATNSASVPVGSVILAIQDSLPGGYLKMDGQSYVIGSTYTALYNEATEAMKYSDRTSNNSSFIQSNAANIMGMTLDASSNIIVLHKSASVYTLYKSTDDGVSFTQIDQLTATASSGYYGLKLLDSGVVVSSVADNCSNTCKSILKFNGTNLVEANLNMNDWIDTSKILYVGGTYYAVGYVNPSSWIFKSTNLTNWTQLSASISSSNGLSISYSANKALYYAVGYNLYCFSNDIENPVASWDCSKSIPNSANNYVGAAVGDMLCAYNASGQDSYFSNDNGTTWSSFRIPQDTYQYDARTKGNHAYIHHISGSGTRKAFKSPQNDCSKFESILEYSINSGLYLDVSSTQATAFSIGNSSIYSSKIDSNKIFIPAIDSGTVLNYFIKY